MARKPKIFVLVDMSYCPYSTNYLRCRLIESQEGVGLFGDKTTNYLIETPSRERMWVNEIQEIS